MTSICRHLYIAPIERFHREPAWLSSQPLLRMELAPLPADQFEVNTIKLAFASTHGVLQILAADGSVLRERHTDLGKLFDRMRPTPELRDLARPFDAAWMGSLVPLLVTHALRDERGSLGAAHFYNHLRMSDSDALFIRTSETPSPLTGCAAALSPAELLRSASELQQQKLLFMSNHQRYYRKCLAGKELEVKFTLQGDADIWALTTELYAAIEQGDLPGYILEYKDEFQRWDYPTQLFEITAPEASRGYISFIPTTDGRMIVKQKQFQRDARIRSESISAPMTLQVDVESFLRSHYDVEFRRLPTLRRVRFDVNFESLRTGHVYGIFFDRVHVIGAEDSFLVQCEVEYLRSRCACTPKEALVHSEFEDILAWTRLFLESRKIASQEGYYSKLSFLRDAVASGRTRHAVTPAEFR